MKLLIAGSRSWIPTDGEISAAVFDLADRVSDRPGDRSCLGEYTCLHDLAVVSGCARGVDRAGEAWASVRHIPIDRHPAEWDRLGKRAGPIRNEAMGDACTHAVIFRDDGESRGTDHMLSVLRRLGRPFVLVTRKGMTWHPAPGPIAGLFRAMAGVAVEAAGREEAAADLVVTMPGKRGEPC